MYKILKTLGSKVIICVTIAAIGFGIYKLPFILGHWSNSVDKEIGTEHTSNQREKFKESKSYIEGMINDLANYKREYERAESEEEKQQVANYIDSHFSNFDAELIENKVLYDFLYQIRNNELN